MKTLSWASLAALGLAFAIAGGVRADETWSVSGASYTVKRVVSVTDARVTVLHAGGMSQFALADLSTELQDRFGYRADKARREEVELAAKRQETAAAMASQLEAQKRAAEAEEIKELAAARLAQQALRIAAVQSRSAQARPPLPESSRFDVNEMVGKLKGKTEREAVALLGEPDARREIDQGRTHLMIYRAAILDKRAKAMADFYLYFENSSFGGFQAVAWGRQGIRTRIPLKDT